VIRGSTRILIISPRKFPKGISQVSLQTGLPVVFGVITADTIEQAIERAGTKEGNKGADAAQSAIEMTNLFAKL